MPRIKTVASALVVLVILTRPCGAEEEQEDALDIEFLEWLGQASAVEDLGVDINELLKAQEQKAQSESDEDDSE